MGHVLAWQRVKKTFASRFLVWTVGNVHLAAVSHLFSEEIGSANPALDR